MSRYIDADVFKVSITKYGALHLSHKKLPIIKNEAKELIRDICFAIDAQSTVDAVPVKHGHWIRGKAYPHHIFCSNCYRTYVPNDETEMWKDQTRLPRNYCPECGAKMDEVTE